VPLVEWLSADGSEHLGSVDLEPPAAGRTFLALHGGGLLAVGGCNQDDEPVADAWWIDRDLQAVLLPALPAAARSCQPKLVAASLGAPLLLVEGAVWRFDPWQGTFALSDLELGLEPGVNVAHATAIDAGFFYWLAQGDAGASLFGLRHDTRNRYSADVTPFLLADNSRLAPIRPATGEAYARYDGSLELLGDTSEVWVSDTLYADFELELVLGDDSAPPLLLVGSRAFGSGDCAWPQGQGSLQVERRASQIALRRDSRSRQCSLGSNQALPIGLRGRSEPGRVTQLTISRGAP
jgi:hypothetical protein